MKALGFSVLILFCLAVLLCVFDAKPAIAQQKFAGEMLIQVNANIIALPQGEAAKVPISAARFRSTEMRELNEQYEALSIEKLYELKEEAKGTDVQGLNVLKSEKKDKKKDQNIVDLSRVFTKKVKKEFKKKGKEVKQVSDAFLLQFESEKEIPILEIVSAYKALDVVIHAEHITRSR